MYIDANIFVYAAISEEPIGEVCRDIMDLVNDRVLTVTSSYMSIQELLWVVKRTTGRESASRISATILGMPVRWVDVGQDILARTLDAFSTTSLDVRDAMHVATMRKAGISTLISEDRDFDRVKGIRRMGASEVIDMVQ